MVFLKALLTYLAVAPNGHLFCITWKTGAKYYGPPKVVSKDVKELSEMCLMTIAFVSNHSMIWL